MFMVVIIVIVIKVDAEGLGLGLMANDRNIENIIIPHPMKMGW